MRIRKYLIDQGDALHKLKALSKTGEVRLIGLFILEILRQGGSNHDGIYQGFDDLFGHRLYPEASDCPLVRHVHHESLMHFIEHGEWTAFDDDGSDIIDKALARLIDRKAVREGVTVDSTNGIYYRTKGAAKFEGESSEAVRDWFAAIMGLSLLERIARGF